MLSPVKVNDMIASLAEHAVSANVPVWDVADRIEKQYLELVLDSYKRNQVHAARALRIHRNTLRQRMYRLGIQP